MNLMGFKTHWSLLLQSWSNHVSEYDKAAVLNCALMRLYDVYNNTRNEKTPTIYFWGQRMFMLSKAIILFRFFFVIFLYFSKKILMFFSLEALPHRHLTLSWFFLILQPSLRLHVQSTCWNTAETSRRLWCSTRQRQMCAVLGKFT